MSKLSNIFYRGLSKLGYEIKPKPEEAVKKLKNKVNPETAKAMEEQTGLTALGDSNKINITTLLDQAKDYRPPKKYVKPDIEIIPTEPEIMGKSDPMAGRDWEPIHDDCWPYRR